MKESKFPINIYHRGGRKDIYVNEYKLEPNKSKEDLHTTVSSKNVTNSISQRMNHIFGNGHENYTG